jgi:hypothetical protein
MAQGLLEIATPAFTAGFVTFAAWVGRRKGYPQFSSWWKAEGNTIFAWVWITFMVTLLLAR